MGQNVDDNDARFGRVAKLVSPKDGEKGLFYNEKPLKSLSGDLVDVVMMTYKYEGEDKYKWRFIFHDVNKSTGEQEIDTYEIPNEESNSAQGAINCFLSLPSPMNVEMGWYLSKDGKYANPKFSCDGIEIKWKYQQSELPAPVAHPIGNSGKFVYDNTNRLNFLREQVAVKYRELFGKEWAWKDLIGGGKIEASATPPKPATPAPAQPANVSPPNKPGQDTSSKVAVQLADKPFGQMLAKIAQKTELGELQSDLTKFFAFVKQGNFFIDTQQAFDLQVAINKVAILFKLPMVLAGNQGDISKGLQHGVFEFTPDDLPF